MFVACKKLSSEKKREDFISCLFIRYTFLSDIYIIRYKHTFQMRNSLQNMKMLDKSELVEDCPFLYISLFYCSLENEIQ